MEIKQGRMLEIHHITLTVNNNRVAERVRPRQIGANEGESRHIFKFSKTASLFPFGFIVALGNKILAVPFTFLAALFRWQ
jgi:hypothetical protein